MKRLDNTSTAFGMQINAEKTKQMTNNTNGFSTDIRVNGEKLDCGSNIWEQSSQMKDLNLKFSSGSPRPQQHSPNSRSSGMTGI